jgi:hypothetical protein
MSSLLARRCGGIAELSLIRIKSGAAARHQRAMARKIKKLTSAIWASCTEPSSSLLIVQTRVHRV